MWEGGGGGVVRSELGGVVCGRERFLREEEQRERLEFVALAGRPAKPRLYPGGSAAFRSETCDGALSWPRN